MLGAVVLWCRAAMLAVRCVAAGRRSPQPGRARRQAQVAAGVEVSESLRGCLRGTAAGQGSLLHLIVGMSLGGFPLPCF